MKKLIIALVAFATAFAYGEDTYVFTADGVYAATSPRQLPQVGRDFDNGGIVSNLTEQTPAVLANCGWYRVEMPEVTLGALQYSVITGYTFSVSNDTAYAHVEVRDGAPLKKYTQYKIIGALMQLGKWNDVKQYLVAHDLYDLFMGAQYITNADPNFLAAKKLVAQLLQVDEGALDAMLDRGIDDE